MNRKQKRALVQILLSVALSAVAYFLPINGAVRVAAFCVPYLIIGYDVLFGAVRNLLHAQMFDEKLLMSIATLGAFLTDNYLEATGVMLFYKVGELFESIAVGKSRRSISSLMDICPEFAVVVREGQEVRVEPDEVELSEIILIRPGEKIPLDGEIVEGTTTVNTAALTGESLPSDKTVGDKVVSGTLNLSGVIRVRTESLYSESTVSKILELVENSSEKKARAEGFITRFARYYTPCVVVCALLLALVPPLAFSGDWKTWVNRALTFLVVSCPCALVVSVPLTFFAGIGGASKKGILVKGSNYLEVLSRVDTVVFDKTGTLTKGSFSVEAIHPMSISEAELLDITAAAESYSTHPVAESVVAAHKGHIDRSRIGEVKELAGKGIEARVDGRTFFVGNGRLMEEIGANWHECHLTGTVVHIAEGKEYLGHIVINDELKPDSKAAIAALKELGVSKTVMLTGDSEAVARLVSERLSIDEYRWGLLPNQKVEQVEELLAQGKRLAFVGDGINDAPVLTRADVGIAMGALGSDAAIESADIVLMDDKPSKISVAVKVAKRTTRIVRQNIVISLAVKAIILILSAVGLTGMWLAVFGDVGVLVLAVLNAMRALKIKEDKANHKILQNQSKNNIMF